MFILTVLFWVLGCCGCCCGPRYETKKREYGKDIFESVFASWMEQGFKFFLYRTMEKVEKPSQANSQKTSRSNPRRRDNTGGAGHLIVLIVYISYLFSKTIFKSCTDNVTLKIYAPPLKPDFIDNTDSSESSSVVLQMNSLPGDTNVPAVSLVQSDSNVSVTAGENDVVSKH